MSHCGQLSTLSRRPSKKDRMYRSSRRSSSLARSAAVSALAVLGLAIIPAAGSSAATGTTIASGPSATTPTIPDVAPSESNVPSVTVVAAARNRLTAVYESATATKPFKTFDNRLNFSGRHVFLVIAQEGNAYKVQLPMRPNGRVGYVKAADVTLYQHDYALKVDLSDHSLIVFKGGKEIQRETVAVGQAKYPTPTGSFFLRELAKPGNPRGSYGPWAFGLSAYSNVLQKFGRGDGQIGIHGTNQPRALGTDASHGCIRMKNVAITKLAQTLPQGVPIEIVA